MARGHQWGTLEFRLLSNWYYITLPPTCKPIGYKWVFKVKYHKDKSIKRYKRKLIVQEFSQVHSIVYTETFALTIRWQSLRIFFAITVILGMILLQINVIVAYLESTLDQNNQLIYIKIPQEYLIRWQKLVSKSPKSLYGLKQVKRLLNKTIINFFQKIRFTLTNADPYILVYK